MEENEVDRQQFKRSLKIKIDLALFKVGKDFRSFSNELQKQGIHIAIRQNAQGLIYGVTYVDHIDKTVFKGNEIGKEYSAKGLLEKLNVSQQKENVSGGNNRELSGAKTEDEIVAGEIKKIIENQNLLVDLLQPEKKYGYLPSQFRKKKRKNQLKGSRL